MSLSFGPYFTQHKFYEYSRAPSIAQRIGLVSILYKLLGVMYCEYHRVEGIDDNNRNVECHLPDNVPFLATRFSDDLCMRPSSFTQGYLCFRGQTATTSTLSMVSRCLHSIETRQMLQVRGLFPRLPRSACTGS